MNDLEKENQQLRGELEKLRNEMKELQSNTERLRQKAADAAAALKAAEEAAAKATAEAAAADAKLKAAAGAEGQSQIQISLSSLQNEKQKLHAELDALKAELGQWRTKLNDAEAAQQIAEQGKVQLEAESSAAKAQAADACSERDTVTKQLADTKRQLKALQLLLDESNREVAVAHTLNSQLQKDKDDAVARAQEAEQAASKSAASLKVSENAQQLAVKAESIAGRADCWPSCSILAQCVLLAVWLTSLLRCSDCLAHCGGSYSHNVLTLIHCFPLHSLVHSAYCSHILLQWVPRKSWRSRRKQRYSRRTKRWL